MTTMLWTAALDDRGGRKATMNLRVDASGGAVRSGDQTEIGGNDRYLALCRRHFSEALGANGRDADDE